MSNKLPSSNNVKTQKPKPKQFPFYFGCKRFQSICFVYDILFQSSLSTIRTFLYGISV